MLPKKTQKPGKFDVSDLLDFRTYLIQQVPKLHLFYQWQDRMSFKYFFLSS